MKWLENSTSIAAAVEKWDKTPVDVVPIDTAGVAALRKNGTKKVRLFNVLRGSRQTELTEKFPAHVVSFRLSNTPRVAVQHYLQVRDSDFERAAKSEAVALQNRASQTREDIGKQSQEVQKDQEITEFYDKLRLHSGISYYT